MGGFQLAVGDFALVEHPFGRFGIVGLGVFVGEVDYLLDARLDDRLGALVAGKEADIDAASFQVAADRVEDRVQFGVADIRVLRFEPLSFALPGDEVVIHADGKSVVPDADDLVLATDDARPHLGVGVFAAHRRELGDSHEVLVPADIVLSLMHRAPP